MIFDRLLGHPRIEYAKNSEGIKNPGTMHLLVDGRYSCIKACLPTKEKSTTDRSKVTCKNCKQKMKND